MTGGLGPGRGGERVVGIVREGDLMRRVEHADERHQSWWLRLFSAAIGDAAFAQAVNQMVLTTPPLLERRHRPSNRAVEM